MSHVTKYRKKPVVIDAVQWHGANVAEILSFTNGLATPLKDAEGKVDRFVISTLEGDHLASFDDWIVRGVKGEFYPVKPDIFAATYDAVVDAELTPAITFEDRMAGKRQGEEQAEQQKTEKLTSAYMERTGRTEMKP